MYQYNHNKFMQGVKEGEFFIENADKWTDFSECKVIKGIYNKIPLDNGQIKHEHIGDITTTYQFAVNYANDKIRIDNKVYAVSEDREFAIKIMKTKIRAIDGAKGLMRFLCRDSNNGLIWIDKIIENVKPMKF